jgi:hypothetical protein
MLEEWVCVPKRNLWKCVIVLGKTYDEGRWCWSHFHVCRDGWLVRSNYPNHRVYTRLTYDLIIEYMCTYASDPLV